ncbi:hypothetical protein Tco_0792951 [Tanacetum coccineum]
MEKQNSNSARIFTILGRCIRLTVPYGAIALGLLAFYSVGLAKLWASDFTLVAIDVTSRTGHARSTLRIELFNEILKSAIWMYELVGFNDSQMASYIRREKLEVLDELLNFIDVIKGGSTVTYTAVYNPFADLPDIGSLGVDGPPVIPEDLYAYMVATFQAPPSPDYVPGPEYPPLPEFVPEPVYLEFMPLEDEILPTEEQPLPAAVSPTADSPGYVPESDPEEDPKEDDDEDPEEDPADYPADKGDDDDDEDESSDNDEDKDVNIEGDEEDEEHPDPADSTVVALPAIDQAPSAEETEPFETDESAATPPPHPAYWVTARISIRDEPPTPFWSDTEIPSPPLPPILSPPLPVSSPPPASPIRLLGYRAAMIRLRAEAPSTSHSPPPHIILSHTRPDAPSSGTPPLHLLSTDRRADRPEVTLPPRKRLGISLGPRYEVGESSSAPTARPPRGFRVDYGFVATIEREIMWDLERDVGYGITDTWDEMPVDMPGAPATDDTELGRRMTKFTTRVRQDTDEIYTRLDDEQSERQLMAGRLNILYKDRRAHDRTARLMEAEARMYREALG